MIARYVVLGLLLLALPATVFSGLHSPVASAGSSEASMTKGGAAKARQHLRCWQYGQLIFEESHLAVASESIGPAVKMRKADGDGPVLLFDTRNATCLIDGGPEYGGGTPRLQ